MYRAPWDNNFWDKLEENIEQVKSLCKTQNMLLLGHLNADFETINGRKLLDLCTQHNLHCINEPTRITETSKTCLDQILINTPNFICESTVEPPVCNNDHCSVGIKLNFKVPCECPYYRVYGHTKKETMMVSGQQLGQRIGMSVLLVMM